MAATNRSEPGVRAWAGRSEASKSAKAMVNSNSCCMSASERGEGVPPLDAQLDTPTLDQVTVGSRVGRTAIEQRKQPLAQLQMTANLVRDFLGRVAKHS